MKNILINLTISFNVLILSFFSTSGQTNVSGIINTTTTWTLANSPYIVTDTVFVTSLTDTIITLTIEPGVIVKFEKNKSIILKDAYLLAEGNSNDSITFTSNSIDPVSNRWDGIILTNYVSIAIFRYCNFNYAKNAVTSKILYNGNGSVGLFNCSLFNNIKGVYSDYNSASFFIDSCTFRNNSDWAIDLALQSSIKRIKHSNIIDNGNGVSISTQTEMENCIVDSNFQGIKITTAFGITIINCEVKYNRGTGLYGYDLGYNTIISNNQIENNYLGCEFHSFGNVNFTCNRICNNTTYDFMLLDFGNTLNLPNNYWCSSDSATISSHIFDGYDQFGLSIVNFIPYDTALCYLNTGVSSYEAEDSFLELFPNPSQNYLKISTSIFNQHFDIYIYNIYGEFEYFKPLNEDNELIDISSLPDGIYFLQLIGDKKCISKKFIKY